MLEPDSRQVQGAANPEQDVEPMEESANDVIVNLIAGGLLGAVGGAGLGFSVSLAFAGWAVLAFFAGGVLGGVLGMTIGYVRGDSFTEWLKENLWRFW